MQRCGGGDTAPRKESRIRSRFLDELQVRFFLGLDLTGMGLDGDGMSLDVIAFLELAGNVHVGAGLSLRDLVGLDLKVGRRAFEFELNFAVEAFATRDFNGARALDGVVFLDVL